MIHRGTYSVIGPDGSVVRTERRTWLQIGDRVMFCRIRTVNASCPA